MNPAVAATGTGGLAGAVVVVLNALLSHWGIVPDASVVAAEVTIAASLAGVGAHYLTRVAPDMAAVVAPEAPKP